MSRTTRDRPAEDGYILVAVLGVMLLLTGFMAAGSLVVRSGLGTAKVGDTDAAMAGLTRGGLELTAYQLFQIEASPAEVDGRRIRFGGGTIASKLTDEGGKADLNGSDPKLLVGVFRAAGLDGRTTDSLLAYVVEMRGADRNPPTPGAPVASAADALANPTTSESGGKRRLRGFQSIDQLMDFPGLPQPAMRTLASLLTVFNPDGKINVRSASPKMLDAVPGLPTAVAQAIARRRDEASRREIEALLATAKEAQPYIKTEFGPAFTVRLDATSAKGRKKTINAVVAASKSPSVPYYVLDWWE